jgi:hypothetical protein
MSFIRPELRKALLRWREVIVCGLLILWGVWLIGVGLDRESVMQTLLGGAIVVVFVILIFWAILRAKMYKPPNFSGVVQVKEREVGYLCSEVEVFVSLDDLTKLEIVTKGYGRSGGEVFWVLSHEGGEPIAIPANTEGSELLFDAFAVLTDADFEEAVRALNGTQDARFLIWEKRVVH